VILAVFYYLVAFPNVLMTDTIDLPPKRIPLLEERVMDLEERLHIAVRINTEYIRRYGRIHRRES